MRTQDEIVARIGIRKGKDFLGFEIGIYYNYLDYEHLKLLLELKETYEDWEKAREKNTPTEGIRAYMPFAWGKANDHRGISANRSIEHFIAWVWLDGDDTGWLEKEYDKHYCYYGKPLLVKICEKYGVDWRKLDDNCWSNSERGTGITADKALKRNSVPVIGK